MAGSAHSGKSADAAGRPESREPNSRAPDGSTPDGSAEARNTGQPPDGAASPEISAAPRPSLWLSTPWIAILFITGVFHLYRGVPVDAAIFLLAGLALAVDTAVRHVRHGGRGPDRARPDGPTAFATNSAHEAKQRKGSGAGEVRSTRPLPRWWWIVIAAAVGALSLAVVALAPESSAGIPAVVGLVGAAMLLVAWPDPPRPPGRPAPRVGRAAYWWAGVVLFLCIWELGTYFIDRFAPADTAAFPPLTDLLQPLFDSDSSRWFMTALWLVACGALMRVVRRP